MESRQRRERTAEMAAGASEQEEIEMWNKNKKHVVLLAVAERISIGCELDKGRRTTCCGQHQLWDGLLELRTDPAGKREVL